MPTIRTAAKAVIVDRGRLLTIRCRRDDEPFLILPGGGQEADETLHETMRRECLEEIGCAVEVGDLLFVREYRSTRHEFALARSGEHSIEFMFACTLVDEVNLDGGHETDLYQIGIEWVDLADLASAPFWPQALKPLIPQLPSPASAPVYLGDVN